MGNKILEVYTLGNFKVKKEDMILSDMNTRSNKMWDLFQYLISHPEQITPVDILIEDINLPMELINAKNALENLVYRLRKLLSCGDEKYRPDKYIIFKRGGYSFNWEEDHFLDFLEFQSSYQKGTQYYEEGKLDQSFQEFWECYNLYRGNFLQENTDSPHLLQQRIHFRELFFKQSKLTCEILKKQKDYSRIEKVCRRVLKIEPFEEEFHSLLIESLLKKGEERNAALHYDYTMSLFSKNKINLSSNFVNILEKRKKHSINKFDFNDFIIEFKNKDKNDLILLDPENFTNILRIFIRKKERDSGPLCLVSLNINQENKNSVNIPKKEIKNNLEEILHRNIRKSDFVCSWNKMEYLLLFAGIGEENLLNILNRIKQSFYQLNQSHDIILNTDYKYF